MSADLFVRACGLRDKTREKQIDAILEKYRVRLSVHTIHEDGTVSGGGFTEVDWNIEEYDHGEVDEIEIYVPGEEQWDRSDPLQRAQRLATELAFCGMATRVSTVPSGSKGRNAPPAGAATP
jgi:hypothetical protein